MPSRRRLIIVGVITLIVGLIVLFPARVIHQWVSPPGVVFAGIEGTVWHGSAQQMLANGVYVRELNWRLKPLALLTAKLAYALKAQPGSGFIETDFALSLGGDVYLSNLTGSLPLALLQKSFGIRGLQGNASIQFERLQIAAGLPVAAVGTVEVAGLVVPLITTSSIGGYRAEFFTQEDGVFASVEDTDGVVDIAGKLQLSEGRNYQFLGRLAPKAETPQPVRQQMQFLGNANERGQFELRLEGQL